MYIIVVCLEASSGGFPSDGERAGDFYGSESSAIAAGVEPALRRVSRERPELFDNRWTLPGGTEAGPFPLAPSFQAEGLGGPSACVSDLDGRVPAAIAGRSSARCWGQLSYHPLIMLKLSRYPEASPFLRSVSTLALVWRNSRGRDRGDLPCRES